MPKYWGLGTKKETFVVTPRGPHSKANCIPLQVVLRDLLGYAKTSKEAQSILSQGKILVDGKPGKDRKFGIGLMDVLEIPDIKKIFRVEVRKSGLVLNETNVSNKKLCKIIGKTSIKGGKTQLNFHDGRNVLVDKVPYKVGDTLEISLKDSKILSHMPLEKGSEALIIAGKNRGVRGSVTEVIDRKHMMETASVALEADGKKETLKDYVFVIGSNASKKENK